MSTADARLEKAAASAMPSSGWIIFDIAHPAYLTAPKPPGERPLFHAGLYALDLLLPIGDLNYQGAWIARGWARGSCIIQSSLFGHRVRERAVASDPWNGPHAASLRSQGLGGPAAGGSTGREHGAGEGDGKAHHAQRVERGRVEDLERKRRRAVADLLRELGHQPVVGADAQRHRNQPADHAQDRACGQHMARSCCGLIPTALEDGDVAGPQ
jgi:hypothetical protein